MQTQSRQLQELLEMLGFYRGMVLDACEQEMSDSPRWAFLRSRLLKIFGQRGMEEKIISIMSHSTAGREIYAPNSGEGGKP